MATWKHANIFRRPREGGDPVAFVKKTLDSRFRGNDGERISMFRNLRVEKLIGGCAGAAHQLGEFLFVCADGVSKLLRRPGRWLESESLKLLQNFRVRELPVDVRIDPAHDFGGSPARREPRKHRVDHHAGG